MTAAATRAAARARLIAGIGTRPVSAKDFLTAVMCTIQIEVCGLMLLTDALIHLERYFAGCGL